MRATVRLLLPERRRRRRRCPGACPARLACCAGAGLVQRRLRHRVMRRRWAHCEVGTLPRDANGWCGEGDGLNPLAPIWPLQRTCLHVGPLAAAQRGWHPPYWPSAGCMRQALGRRPGSSCPWRHALFPLPFLPLSSLQAHYKGMQECSPVIQHRLETNQASRRRGWPGCRCRAAAGTAARAPPLLPCVPAGRGAAAGRKGQVPAAPADGR